MVSWLTDEQRGVLEAACERIIPADENGPGAKEAGVADYIENLLGAFEVDPPMIWAGGPTSGRRGGEPGFSIFHRLTPLDELAWRTRIEGSRGIPEREFNGPVIGLQERYRSGLEALGADFSTLSPQEQDEKLRSHPEFTQMLHHHCCEAMYGAPEYGGNRDEIGWKMINWAGDVQPRGWSDEEVSTP